MRAAFCVGAWLCTLRVQGPMPALPRLTFFCPLELVPRGRCRQLLMSGRRAVALASSVGRERNPGSPHCHGLVKPREPGKGRAKPATGVALQRRAHPGRKLGQRGLQRLLEGLGVPAQRAFRGAAGLGPMADRQEPRRHAADPHSLLPPPLSLFPHNACMHACMHTSAGSVPSDAKKPGHLASRSSTEA